LVVAEATALCARAIYTSGPSRTGTNTFARLRDRTEQILGLTESSIDIPVAGLALFALGSWALTRNIGPPVAAIRLLVFARRFAYQRARPSRIGSRAESAAERRAPGAVERIEDELGDRHGPALSADARTLLAHVHPEADTNAVYSCAHAAARKSQPPPRSPIA